MKTSAATIGAFEAKNSFSELLEKVGRGAEITITKHDKPVARLLPVRGVTREMRIKATAELRAMSKQFRLGGMSIRAMIDEGRA